MDNEKMHEGKNITYMSFSISLHVRIDRHGRRRYRIKILQILLYETNNAHIEVN
jgi:hypothetical protein